MKKLLFILASIAVVFALCACEDNKPAEQNESNNTKTSTVDDSARVQEIMNNPDALKNKTPDADYQIQVAMQKYLFGIYGDDIYDIQSNVKKIYSAEEEQEIEGLKELKLGPDEVAFEVDYRLNANPSGDIDKLLIPNGWYDESTGWVKGKSAVGVLRPDGDSYKITNFGTAW